MKAATGVTLVLAALSMGMVQGAPAGGEGRVRSAAAASRAAVAEWDQRIDVMARAGELRVLTTREDTMIPGRAFTRFEQRHRGVPVWGGEVVRQTDGAFVLTVFGNLYEGIEIAAEPRLTESGARLAIEGLHGSRNFFPDEVTLTVLPREGGAYALAWRGRVVTANDIRMVFVDANTGQSLLDYSDLQSQTAAVGTGAGVLGDPKKISARTDAAGFAAEDLLRPPAVRTYDLKKDHVRADAFYRGVIALSITGDVAKDSDNAWTDPAVVDAQVYAGYTYDYYYKRFGRRGLDNANIRIASVVHPIDRDAVATLGPLFPNFYCNAFYLGNGFMFYGEGLPAGWFCDGQRINYWSGALDIVGHELTHGVTGFSSRLTYEGESGALNEAFSDMMGTAIEFFFQTPGTGLMQADYLESEDIVTAGPSNPLNGIRSMQNPRLFDDPDHYSIRYTGSSDNGGVHTNSGIANHAFYLAIEGGTHRLGARVTGVGAANREQIERVFYRAFTAFLVPSSNFASARVATIQAARELYPTNPAVEAAITQAWTAVGVN